MKNSIKFTIFALTFFSGIVCAIEEEVLFYVGEESYTDVQVAEQIKKYSYYYTMSKPSHVEYIYRKVLPNILLEYYAEQKSITVNEHDITEAIAISRKVSVEQLEDYEKSTKPVVDPKKEIKRKRSRQHGRVAAMQNKVAEFVDPNYKNPTEAEINAFVEDYRKSHHPATFGHQESFKAEGGVSLSIDYIDDKTSIKELEKIKNRLNNGEKFDDIAKEYSEKKEFTILNSMEWQMTRSFKKEGLDALVPWSLLKGKAVIVSTAQTAKPRAILVKISDYHPDARKDIRDAVKDKYLREEVLQLVRMTKQGRTIGKALNKVKPKMKYVYDMGTTYKKVLDAFLEMYPESKR